MSTVPASGTEAARRVDVRVRGAVQGVGFRPFVYRLARELGLSGFVANDAAGVRAEVEGDPESVARFLERLRAERPPLSRIHAVELHWRPPIGGETFTIQPSDGEGTPTVSVLPDVATCPRCLEEILDPSDRRYRYPFANCTHCGPRFSIVRALPYDRATTTMADFPLCPSCRGEYDDPEDRRFHAQPTACAACGPALALLDNRGDPVARQEAALDRAVRAVREGKILALKGLGGFHLVVDAGNDEAIRTLRSRKRRDGKPFALLVPHLEAARALCEIGPEAEAALASAEAPILLLPRRRAAGLAEVAPGCADLGIMLPATPLHHLFVRAFGGPVVATSGNVHDEPICFRDDEAIDRLGRIADLFLTHDRPIARHVDDSVGRIVDGRLELIRRARGFAPLPVRVPGPIDGVLAVGAHQKNTVAIGLGNQVVLSQHLGDLETVESTRAFERAIDDLKTLWGFRPAAIACDLHPDYLSTRWAERQTEDPDSPFHGLPLIRVQHHHAHLAACLAENGVVGDALGVTWDGTGLGTDRTIWGGEFLAGSAIAFRRVASLLPFRLLGGAAAVREPWRVAMALLAEAFAEDPAGIEALPVVRETRPFERRVLEPLLRSTTLSPWTTSAGRLFDGVAAIVGLGRVVAFEGQAAMQLEAAAEAGTSGFYPMPLVRAGGGPGAVDAPAWVLDWRPMIRLIAADVRRKVPVGTIAARFHATLVEGIREVARESGYARVALTGGCFQNRLLTEETASRLRGAGFEVLLHAQVPPNDGGISLGQAMVAAAQRTAGR